MYSAYTQTQVEILKLTSEAKYATCIPPCPLSSLSSLLLLPLPSSLSFLSSFPSSLPLLPSSLPPYPSSLPLSLHFFFPHPSALFMTADSRRVSLTMVLTLTTILSPFLTFLHLPSTPPSLYPLRPYSLTNSGKADSQRRLLANCVEEFGLAVLGDVVGDLQVAKGTWSMWGRNKVLTTFCLMILQLVP